MRDRSGNPAVFGQSSSSSGSGRRRTLVAVAALTLIVGGCSSKSPEEVANDTLFLASVKDTLGIQDLKGQDDFLVQLGHDYCKYLESGGLVEAQATMSRILPDEPHVREAIMVSAGNTLCEDIDPRR